MVSTADFSSSWQSPPARRPRCLHLSHSTTPARLLDTTPPRLLTVAACGGLKPTPDGRLRGTFPHLLRSSAPPLLSVRSWHTVVGVPDEDEAMVVSFLLRRLNGLSIRAVTSEKSFHAIKSNIREYWRNNSALRCPSLTLLPSTHLNRPGFEPAFDRLRDGWQFRQQWQVCNSVKAAGNVGVEDPSVRAFPTECFEYGL